MSATQRVAMMLQQAKQGKAGVLIDQGTRKARRLYVGNLPMDEMSITEEMIVSFFNAAVHQAGIANPDLPGEAVVSAWLSQENKFAFVEFRTMDEATSGLGLNGIAMGPNSLKVSRPSDYEDPGTSMMAMQMPGGMPAMPMPAGFPGVDAMPEAAPLSSVIRLTNMISADSIQDDQDIKDITEDVGQECEKHGTVEQVLVPGRGEPGVGNVFVKFSSTEAALNCKSQLNGRLFDGKAVQATFFDEQDFASKKF